MERAGRTAVTALSEALAAAQRASLAALQKAYVNAGMDEEAFAAAAVECGIRDSVDLDLLIANLDVLREYGVDLPAVPQTAPAEEASDRQWNFIRQLADEKGTVAPVGPLTKAQASEVIDSLQAGTYDPDKWKVPF